MAKKWVYLFSEGNATMRNLLGGKGANLAEMTNLGLPVPQGFTITTEACTQYYDDGRKINDEIMGQIMEHIAKMEEITGKNIPCINMVGGGIQDELLCELTAKATGKRVVAGPTEGSVLGNSIVQFVATGAVKSIAEGREIIKNSFELKFYEP